MPSEFQSKNRHTPPSQFQDAACSIGMDILWNHPTIQVISFIDQAPGKLTDCRDDFPDLSGLTI